MPGKGNRGTSIVSFEDAQQLAIAATAKNAALREKVLECLKRYTNGNSAAGGMGGSGSLGGSGTKRTIDDLEEHSTALKMFKGTTADIRQDLEAMDMLCTNVRFEPLIKVKELQVEEVKGKIELEQLRADSAKEAARMAEEAAANASQREEHRRAKEQADKDADLARDEHRRAKEQTDKDADLARDEHRRAKEQTDKDADLAREEHRRAKEQTDKDADLARDEKRFALQLDYETRKAALVVSQGLVVQAYPLPDVNPIIVPPPAPVVLVEALIKDPVVDAPGTLLVPVPALVEALIKDPVVDAPGTLLVSVPALVEALIKDPVVDAPGTLLVSVPATPADVLAGGAGGDDAAKSTYKFRRGGRDVMLVSMRFIFPGAGGDVRTIFLDPTGRTTPDSGKQFYSVIDIINFVCVFNQVRKTKANKVWKFLDEELKNRITSMSQSDNVKGAMSRLDTSALTPVTNDKGAILLVRAIDLTEAENFRSRHPDVFNK
jgi:hypothetical protein